MKVKILVFIASFWVFHFGFALDTIDVQWIAPTTISNIKIVEIKFPASTVEDRVVNFSITVQSTSAQEIFAKLEIEFNSEDISRREIILTGTKKISPAETAIFVLPWTAKEGMHLFSTRLLDFEDTILDEQENLKISVAQGSATTDSPDNSIVNVPSPESESFIQVTADESPENYFTSSDFLPELVTNEMNSPYTEDANTWITYLESDGQRIISNDTLLFGLSEYTGSQPTGLGEDILASYLGSDGFPAGGGNYARAFDSGSSPISPMFSNDNDGDFDGPPAPLDGGFGDQEPVGGVPEPSTFFGIATTLFFTYFAYRKKKKSFTTAVDYGKKTS